MATNESDLESHGSGIDSLQSNNQQTKPTPNGVPKSHELLIKNTFSSLTNTNEDDEKTTDSEPMRKDRVKKAGVTLLLENKSGILRTIGPGNFAKKTYCYKMITGDNIQYFVKIFEDSTMSPTKVAKTLFTNKKLKNRLAPYLLLPAFKPSKTRLDRHTYEIVIYPYIKHCNLEDLTLKALRQGYINPEYHTTKGPPHAPGYKMRLLRRFEQCVTIAIQLKNGGDGYVDMDISPDNFIITTDINDAVDDDDIRWDKITDSNDAKCIKIDHESLMRWKEKFDRVEKPMKTPFKAPEVNSRNVEVDDDHKDEYKEFDVEKANVYQFGTTFIYVLYGQLQDVDENGDPYWKSLPYKGLGSWKKLNWTPKYIDKDMVWLQKCVDKQPNKRPNYDGLLRDIKWELKKLTPPNTRKPRNIPSSSSNRPRRNNFNEPRVIHSNRNVSIIFNPHSIQQQQQQDQYVKQQQYYGQQQQAQRQQSHLQQNHLYRHQQRAQQQQPQNQQNQFHHQQQHQQQHQHQHQQQQQYMNRQRLNPNNNNLRQQPVSQNMNTLQRQQQQRRLNPNNNNFPAQQQQRRLNGNNAFNNNGNQRRNMRR